MAQNTKKKVSRNIKKNTAKKKEAGTDMFGKFFSKIADAFVKWKNEQVLPQIKDIKSLLVYEKQYKYYVPIDCFIAEDLVLTKYDGFLTTFKITNYDLDYYENFEINSKVNMIKGIMKRLPNGYCLHYETQRKKLSKREFIDRPDAPIPTQIATRERFNIINTGETFYKTEQYITISYCPPNERFKFIKDLFSPEVTSEKKLASKEEIFNKWFSQQISDFNNQVMTVMSAYEEQLIECRRLNRNEMMKYLYNNINGLQKDREFRTIPLVERIDDHLITIQPQNEAILKLNGKYVKILTIKAYPEEIETRVFRRLEDLPFEYRMIHRYIPLGKDESIRALKRARTYHSGKLKDKKQIMSSVMSSGKGPDMNINQKAKDKMDEADALVSEVQEDAFSFGYHTFNIIIEDYNRDTLREHVIQIKNIIDANGFVAIEDNTNTLDSLAGCVVGNMSENLRKTTITSDNYVSIMPLSDRLQGKRIHPHFSNDGKFEESLLVTRSMYDLFDFNNHVGDVGHMLCVGRTGGGKSTFLTTTAMQAMKYKGAKIIYFDVGGSSIPLNICSGGTVYEFGTSRISLQPLGDIDPSNSESMNWATNFIEMLIRMQEPKLLGVRTNTYIRDALKSLAATPDRKDRTLTNFVLYLESQSPELAEALQIYTNAGSYGAYLDGSATTINESQFLTFEMEKIMKDEKILMPVLNFLIHKIETELIASGVPVYLFFDECWLFLKDPTMSAFMMNALKTFRKKNTSCVFATQELDDIVKSDIGHVILSQCFTHIYLANDKAFSMDKELYQKMNLNIKEIARIAGAKAKQEYFYKASDNESGKGSGSILFQLKLTPLELAYVGRLNAQFLAVIKKFKEKFKDDIFSINVAWLKFLVKYDMENPKNGVLPLTERDISSVEHILMRYKEKQDEKNAG